MQDIADKACTYVNLILDHRYQVEFTESECGLMWRNPQKSWNW